MFKPLKIFFKELKCLKYTYATLCKNMAMFGLVRYSIKCKNHFSHSNIFKGQDPCYLVLQLNCGVVVQCIDFSPIMWEPSIQCGILPYRFTVWPPGGSIRSRSNCMHDQKHFVPLRRVPLLGLLPTS